MTTKRLFLLAAGCFALTPFPAAEATALQQAPELATDSLRAADTAAVLQLAVLLGIRQPVRLEMSFPHDIGCPVIRALSPVTVHGDRHSRAELTVRRKGRDAGGHVCRLNDTDGAKIRTVGRWVASSAELSEQDQWRIHDGDWYVDVTLDSGVAHDDATLIVRAVRQRMLVNRIPPALRRILGDTLPAIEATDIQVISISPKPANTFEVSTGRGTVLYVSILAGQVLVQNIGSWRS